MSYGIFPKLLLADREHQGLETPLGGGTPIRKTQPCGKGSHRMNSFGLYRLQQCALETRFQLDFGKIVKAPVSRFRSPLHDGFKILQVPKAPFRKFFSLLRGQQRIKRLARQQRLLREARFDLGSLGMQKLVGPGLFGTSLSEYQHRLLYRDLMLPAGSHRCPLRKSQPRSALDSGLLSRRSRNVCGKVTMEGRFSE